MWSACTHLTGLPHFAGNNSTVHFGTFRKLFLSWQEKYSFSKMYKWTKKFGEILQHIYHQFSFFFDNCEVSSLGPFIVKWLCWKLMLCHCPVWLISHYRNHWPITTIPYSCHPTLFTFWTFLYWYYSDKGISWTHKTKFVG